MIDLRNGLLDFTGKGKIWRLEEERDDEAKSTMGEKEESNPGGSFSSTTHLRSCLEGIIAVTA